MCTGVTFLIWVADKFKIYDFDRIAKQLKESCPSCLSMCISLRLMIAFIR